MADRHAHTAPVERIRAFRVEEHGIRCCYHGWLFDIEGHCLEMPCEPQPAGAQCRRVRQPWYPVEERYGLVFAYLGPAERKPVLPRYECLDGLDEGEFLDVVLMTEDALLAAFDAGGVTDCKTVAALFAWQRHRQR